MFFINLTKGRRRVVALSFSSARADLKVGATMFFINLLREEGFMDMPVRGIMKV